MTLQEILMKLDEEGDEVALSNSQGVYTASGLLQSLSPARVMVNAHYQPGLYIAEVNEGGYLGAVLYRVQQ